ncbi:protein of unknown function [Taphrina deformans PYCC 5710]|uniref:mitogen-activated protein kinase kinase n=1 Tax=Taphrina deformans (strain PYCC 5710 / ATCC 11124 / CBS 356.35 / IMI 108563 / JCM 9778 / NBRC 8474) TaxID=1097556 RepID=R4XD05_TAPDE|nr:protein of unknown function [Taphrina deformans PYCC 5710]|eukprot:CCG83694.1 protein of unknown function [Taphrina deformans PYCC 5710]
MKRKNLKGLQLPSTKPLLPDPEKTPTATTPNTSINSLDAKLTSLEIGINFKLDIRQEDLKVMSELGFGNGGTVSKVMHLPSRTLMARKVIKIEAKAEARKRILRELQIMHDCNSPYIVGFYGAYINDNDIHVCMEHMDCGSLDSILAKKGKVPLDVLGKITYSVIEGLTYLYDIHRIIHRDVKPSNILVNSVGKIKICDFGVSGELINSIANTFVGTSTYMSPERIQGAPYTVKGDVWSLGLLLVELATGQFPLGSRAMGVLDLLQLIVREPAPTLDPKTSPELSLLVSQCLKKDPVERASLHDLLNSEFVNESRKRRVDMSKWAKSTQSFKKVNPGNNATKATKLEPVRDGLISVADPASAFPADIGLRATEPALAPHTLTTSI